MKMGIVSRTDRPEAMKVVRDIVELLESRGVEPLTETETALAMEIPGENSDLGVMEPDFMITVGGDGTILRTAMLMHDPGTPILGVNMGSRGFLTEVLPPEVEEAIDRIIRGDYEIEECIKVASRCPDLDRSFPPSLNEVLIASSLPSKTLDMRLSIDDKHILDIQADGTIVAPPTGSTAYNLSTGGSILAPGVDALILSTICPYSYFRSIVVPSGSKITVQLIKPKAEALVIIDGRDYTALKPLSTVEIWLSEQRTRFVRFRSFYERLERRLIFHRIK